MSDWNDDVREDNIIAAVEARKNDKGFMDRLEASIARNKPILDRLAEHHMGLPDRESVQGAGPIHLESNFGGITVYICNTCGALYSHALREQHEPCPTTRTT